MFVNKNYIIFVFVYKTTSFDVYLFYICKYFVYTSI